MLKVRQVTMKQTSIHAAGLLAVFWFVSCQTAFGECGFAGTYAPESRTNRGASSYREEIIGAHRSLPPGSRVVVRNQQKGRSIVVRILDRGLAGLGEIIGLSAGALHALGMEAPAPVCLEVLTYGSESRGYRKMAMRNPLQINPPQKRRYARAGERRRVSKVRARHRTGKRYAKSKRHSRTVRRTSRRRRAAHG
jgi:rare lipoprotein A